MIISRRNVLVIALIAISHLPFGNSVELQPTQEGPCINDSYPPQAFINETWMGTVPVFYLSGGSNYHIYKTALHSLDDDEERLRNVSYEQISNNACFEVRFGATGTAVTAFDGGISNYTNMAAGPGVTLFTPVPIRGTADPCRATITLTDNRSFVFMGTCWLGVNQKGWAVISTTRTLTPEARAMVEAHAESLRFDRNKFFFLGSANCNTRTTRNAN